MLRIDMLLVKKGIVTGRNQGKELINSGRVLVNDKAVKKPSERYDEDVIIKIKGDLCPYVSRGGRKLEKALRVFSISLKGLVAMDIGSSTGGFTDCMLQHGAKKVYAVDVGTNQLVSSLRKNPKVVVMEQTNIRYLESFEIKNSIGFIGTDVSFLSLVHVLPKAYELLEKNGYMVCLVKPQFEAGPEFVGKNGIVSDPKIHISVLKNIVSKAEALGFSSLQVDFSPITGQGGNIEFLLMLKKTEKTEKIHYEMILNTVSRAHEEL